MMSSISEALRRFSVPTEEPSPCPRARVLAVCAQKGGVGKTTTSVNLGAALARFHGLRTLIIDLDGQGHVGEALQAQVDETSGPSVSDVLLGRGRDLSEIVRATRVPNLFATPSDKGLAATEGIMAGRIGKEMLLRGVLRGVREQFDIVLIDCPPNLGNLTLNALTAADGCLVPCDMSVLALSGVGDLMSVVDTVRERLGCRVSVLGVLPTRVDRRNVKVTEAVMDGLFGSYGPLVCSTRIPVSSALARAQMEGVNVFDYDAASSGAEAYEALAGEVLDRLERVG